MFEIINDCFLWISRNDYCYFSFNAIFNVNQPRGTDTWPFKAQWLIEQILIGFRQIHIVVYIMEIIWLVKRF